MARAVARSSRAAALPQWIPPQLTQLVEAAPDGDQWLHEIKFDGYRMHARLDRDAVKLLPAPASTGLTNIRRSQKPWPSSMRARPISTANCAASAPTASLRSTS